LVGYLLRMVSKLIGFMGPWPLSPWQLWQSRSQYLITAPLLLELDEVLEVLLDVLEVELELDELLLGVPPPQAANADERTNGATQRLHDVVSVFFMCVTKCICIVLLFGVLQAYQFFITC
jgi:hypothetical protein